MADAVDRPLVSVGRRLGVRKCLLLSCLVSHGADGLS